MKLSEPDSGVLKSSRSNADYRSECVSPGGVTPDASESIEGCFLVVKSTCGAVNETLDLKKEVLETYQYL